MCGVEYTASDSCRWTISDYGRFGQTGTTNHQNISGTDKSNDTSRINNTALVIHWDTPNKAIWTHFRCVLLSLSLVDIYEIMLCLVNERYRFNVIFV